MLPVASRRLKHLLATSVAQYSKACLWTAGRSGQISWIYSSSWFIMPLNLFRVHVILNQLQTRAATCCLCLVRHFCCRVNALWADNGNFETLDRKI